jgi:hypothetical protein
MYVRLLVSFAVAACVCFSVSLAQIQTTTQQKTPQTIQKSVALSKVDAFLKVLQNAATLKEVQSAFTAASFSSVEVEQIKSRIEGTATLKQKQEQLQNDQLAAMKAEALQFDRLAISRTLPLTTQLNEQRVAVYRKSILALRQSEVANTTDPAVRCQADAPSVTSVSGVTPGVEFAIRGKGFGEYAGTVELVTVGKVFSAHVTGWNSCTIYAQVGDDVTGVRADGQASISITTSTGKRVRAVASFKPALEVKEEIMREWLPGSVFGYSRDYVVWGYSLKNDWYVVATTLHHLFEGHAEITSAPATNVPNGSALTKAHAGVGAFARCAFTLKQSLAGPKGLSYK